MAHRIVGLTLAAVTALGACGGDDNDWPDTAPTSRFDPDTKTNVELEDTEIAVIQNGLDALDDMDDALAQQTFDLVAHAAVFEDWTDVCTILNSAAEVIERDQVLAVNGDAWRTTEAILGESVRYDELDAIQSECGTELNRAIEAQTDTFDS